MLAFWFRVSARPFILRQCGAAHRARRPVRRPLAMASFGAVSAFRYQLRIGRISFPLQFPSASRFHAGVPGPYAMLETGTRHGFKAGLAGRCELDNGAAKGNGHQ